MAYINLINSIDSFCSSKDLSCEQMLLTEVLEWLNSSSGFILGFDAGLLSMKIVCTLPHTEKKKSLPKYSHLKRSFSSHSILTFISTSGFYIPNLPILGGWIIAKIVKTALILAWSTWPVLRVELFCLQ